MEGSSRARADVATLSLWSSGMRSILCTRQKTRASGEYCNKASIAERNCSRSVYARSRRCPPSISITNKQRHLEVSLGSRRAYRARAALDVKDVDQHRHVAEDVLLLAEKVRVHERLLAARTCQIHDHMCNTTSS